MAKPDEAHKWTDEELKKLEERIARVYQEAYEDLDKTVRDYFRRFKERDAEMLERLSKGEITKEYYKQWRLNQIGRGERFKSLRDKMAERVTRAKEIAVDYINDVVPEVYAENRNYAAYTIERVGDGIDFTLFDEHTVKRLIKEAPDLMPYYPEKKAVDRGIDLAYGKKKITEVVRSGILQGKSIGDMADDLMEKVPDMSRTSAVRAARTAVTEAQNAGRMDSYRAAQEMGIKLKKRWLATLDNRTRHAHASLDGQVKEVDKPFESELGLIMYPGDSDADPANVYNCRCTLVSELDDMDYSGEKRRAKDPETGEYEIVENMTYREWERKKKAENPVTWDTFIKKGKNRSADYKQYEEFKKVLGKKAPSRFSDFQAIKYEDDEEWESLKALKRKKGKHRHKAGE